jgi:hypothetical protein
LIPNRKKFIRRKRGSTFQRKLIIIRPDSRNINAARAKKQRGRQTTDTQDAL